MTIRSAPQDSTAIEQSTAMTTPALRIFDFGEAPRAAAEGYSIQELAHGTESDIRKRFFGDLIAVQGWKLGQGGHEWAIMSKKATTSNLDYATAMRLVTDALVACGWDPIVGGTAIARREFQTAVGKKDAFVYFYDSGPMDIHFSLAGNYTSEGANILEPHGMLIPIASAPDQVTALTTTFSEATIRVVNRSYAMRLVDSSKTTQS